MPIYDRQFFESLIPNCNLYFAHLPREFQTDRKPELLSEHSALVMQYARKIAETHNLDNIIEKLITDVVPNNLKNKELLAETITRLFWQAIAFHDFGKLNRGFQFNRMKNRVEILKVCHSFDNQHSVVSVYLFLALFFQDFLKMNFTDKEQVFLCNIALYLSFPIYKHHSPIMSNAQDESNWDNEDLFALKPYLTLFKHNLNEDQIEQFHSCFLSNANFHFFFDHFNNNIDIKSENVFPLFALIKLNYSILTASDYLATTHYMNNWKTVLNDFGQIGNELRHRIIRNVQTTKSHNKAVFDNLEGFEFTYPTEVSNKNLNRLRQELSVEVIQNISSNKDKYVFYIEAPTGGGKTNLSMLAAAELLGANVNISNLYYVFPFTTLITQTYKTVKETMGLNEDEIIQLHSKVGFKEKDDQYGKEKKNHIDYLFLNYPVALMSHVRFFDILKTNSKESNYLLHRLANSVVVVDELQSYPPKIWDKLIYFIQNYARYFNIRFILMSATLPKLDKLSNVATDICYLTNHRSQFFQNPNFRDRISFDFSLMEWTAPEKQEKADYLKRLASVVVEKSVEYAQTNCKYPDSVFTIIEFIYKQTATEFYSIIEEDHHGFFDMLFVLSGTILESRRKEIIHYIKDETNRNKKVLLITTQVVESGVDIDMDLGFKDKSLIDSDEQLAGRINRNVNKPSSILYLFNCDNAEVLYKGDLRFRLMQNELSGLEKEILQSKDFDLMYDQVMAQIDRQNDRIFQQGFSDFQIFLKMLDFPNVDKNFQIINQQSTSVFVPLSLPIYVPGTNTTERNFSEQEVAFLKNYGVEIHKDEIISGEEVFALYEQLIRQKDDDFIAVKTELKKLQGIMSQFIISLMTHSTGMKKLIENVHGEERMGIYYLSHWQKDGIYHYEFGLTDTDEPAIIL